jgi:integrase
MHALISMAAFVGMRPAELYGLRWSDVDLRNDEVRVARQYSKSTRTFELPKNGKQRDIALTGPAKAALLEMPRPLDADELIFRASRGGPITGRVQHYYWHPVRCGFGRPSLDFYELRHFCASWLFNDLALPAQDVAHQLGHSDGGALVQRLSNTRLSGLLASESNGRPEATSRPSRTFQRQSRDRSREDGRWPLVIQPLCNQPGPSIR